VRQLTSLRLAARARAFSRSIEIRPRDDLIMLGSRGYGFWVVPQRLLGPGSTCYLAGIGEDITFDLSLIARFGCTVHAFDPVPAAQEYAVAAARHEPRFVLHRAGLWSSDATLPLHAPAVAGHISHSVTDLHRTQKAFDAEFRSVRSLMDELRHDRLDLLKISAEGSEFEILRSVVGDGIDPSIVCVEFAQPAPAEEADATMRQMTAASYDLVDAKVTPWTWKLTFVRRGSDDG
jgi:FkbM family methyltransferase